MIYIITIILIFLSAIFSGLTLGFFTLNVDDLRRKAKLGDKKAKNIYSVRKNGNLLLCTLLIGNVAVNASLSIFLGSIAPGFVAGLIATGLIVIVGEITPQAVFSRNALRLGSKFVWLTKLFIFLFYPLSWPIAWLLDKVLGKELPTIYSKGELIKIIEEHQDSDKSDLDYDEEKILKGALSFSDKTVAKIMTPRIAVFSLPAEKVLDEKIIKKIFKLGYSRIPVYEHNLDNIIGLLYVKDLILNYHQKNKQIKDVLRKDVVFVNQNRLLDDLLHDFKKIKKHLFIVVDDYNVVMGIVTIEDVLEEIINDEIVDEYDKYEDMRKVARQRVKDKKRKVIKDKK